VSLIGGASLGPEKALFAEAGVEVHSNEYVQGDVGVYVRRTNGMIRSMGPMLVNLGELTLRGVDARVTLMPYWPVRVGGSVSLLDVNSEEFGDEIDRLPEKRSDV
jgi:outer membrane cobalamin receptor